MSTPGQGLSERIVLVVDDNDVVCHMTARILTTAGIRTLEAHDANEALRLLTDLGPNVVGLVVTDVAMPGMTGDKLAAIIAERWPTVPVLLVSGYSDTSPDSRASFLAKPFRPDTLLALVSQVAPSFSTLP
jgi:two-component system, cell cycle sensor histidine kinase and response regulator CckA